MHEPKVAHESVDAENSPRITITAAAATALQSAAADAPGELLRLVISDSFEHELYFDRRKAGDITCVSNDVVVLLDSASARRARGVRIDFVAMANGGGFKIDNPNEPPRVRKLAVSDLAKMFADGQAIEVFDVRPPPERAIASLDRGHSLDDAGLAHLDSLPKTTPIAFLCHHGFRSRSVAEHALGRGYTCVYNIEGGIAAWAAEVDPNVPTY